MEQPMLQIVGTVRSTIADVETAPKHESEPGAVAALVEIEPEFADAVMGLGVGAEIFLFTWLHLAGRDYLQVHPRGDKTRPKRGVFATRSPNRPNPIGLHRCVIQAVERVPSGGANLMVFPLEALDGTPVADIKPADSGRGSPDRRLARDIIETCRMAWSRGLLSGFNGNVSGLLDDGSGRVLITRSGSAKGALLESDILAVDPATGRVEGQGKISSESPMHFAVYDQQPEARAIVHTHPAHLLALSLKVDKDKLLAPPVFEADMYRAMFGCAPDLEPGTQQLADAVGVVAREKRAILMERHGLVCWGATLGEALGLSEEIESLARLQLLTL